LSQYAQDPSENLAKAEAAAKQAIESDPLESKAHAALANVLCSQGSFEACKLEFDRALQISPSSFELPILVESKPNARWSVDFVHDQLACGRRLRILNIVDDVTRGAWRRFLTPRSQAGAWRGN
jgi:tetratricopeptide (TPR) repeat protein